MENKEFLHACKLINTDLIRLKMDRTFNSIGSNVFFEFGKEKKVEVIKGKKVIEKEWSIWLSHASWRITIGNKYVVGSGDFPKTIQSNIQSLLGKQFQSFRFLSQFLDIEFNFEDGYQITTFFNWMEENQWTIFLSDNSNIGVDCSSEEALKNVHNISKHFKIEEKYKKMDLLLKRPAVINIAFNKWNLPMFHFENGASIHLEACAWRLEKSGHYVIGCLDGDLKKIKSELVHLVGKKLKLIDIANPMMDARFQFEDGFILKTFSCCQTEEQWKIYEEKRLVFSAKIPLLKNQAI